MKPTVVRTVASAPLVMIALFVVFPVVTIAAEALDRASLTAVLDNEGLRAVAWFTLWQALLSTVLTVAAALPVTWVVSRRLVRWWRPLRGLVTAPFLMPTVVMAVAVRAALPAPVRSGLVPIVVAHVLFNVAVVVRTVGPRWETLPEERLDAARVLGASPWRVATTVVVPHLRSSVLHASTAVFVFCFTSFGVVSVLGGLGRRTVEVEIFRRAVQIGDTSSAVALSLVQVAVILLVVGIVRPAAAAEPPSTAARERREGVRRRPVGVAAATIAALSSCIVIAPSIALLVRSLRTADGWSWRGWRALVDGSLATFGVDVPRAFVHSTVFTAACIGLAVPMAVAAALATVHLRHGRLVSVFSLLPLVVSSVTLGFGIVLAFDRAPLDWRGSAWMLPVVHALVALPLAVRVLIPALAGVDERQREAARVLGAGGWRTFVDIDLRQSRGAILGASGLAASVSLGEFGATSLLARRDSATLPLVIGRLAGRVGDLPQQGAYALAVVMAVVVIGVSARA